MQAVILAAGKSSRFYPFRDFSHKSLVSVMGKPIIVHTAEAVRRAGVKDLIVVVSQDSEITNILGNGSSSDLNIKYVIQKEPTGGGDGLLLCEKELAGDFFLLNSSRVDFDLFKEEMLSKKTQDVDAVLLGKKQDRLGKYGVLKVDGDTVVDLIEKPEAGEEPSDIRLIGIYLFSKDFLSILKKSSKDHYSLESSLGELARNGNVKLIRTSEKTPSLKYSWDLLEVKDYLLSKISGIEVSNKAKVSKSAEIIGDVVVEEGVQIMEGAKIKGPCYIGRGTVIGNNAVVRDGTCVEENCVIGANMEIKNTLIMKNTKVHSGFVGDSIIGQGVRIGAGFNTANKRIDRKTVIVNTQEGTSIDTSLVSLGAIIGNGARIGINVSIMPGARVGNNTTVGPSTTVSKDIPANSKYYTKFQEVVQKNDRSAGSGHTE